MKEVFNKKTLTSLLSNQEDVKDFICKYCSKSFSTEKTLLKHMFVKKKRHAEKDTIGAKLGFRVFQRFYELTTASKTPKSQDQFIDSSYYTSFVKFGRYLVELDPIYIDRFIDFVIKNGVKLNDWHKEYVYLAFLEDIFKKEAVESAIERTVLEMQSWAESNNKQLGEYFKCVTTPEATFKIRAGRISPWVIYLSESGGELLSRMSSEQEVLIRSFIDPNAWRVIFMKQPADVEFVEKLLKDFSI